MLSDIVLSPVTAGLLIAVGYVFMGVVTAAAIWESTEQRTDGDAGVSFFGGVAWPLTWLIYILVWWFNLAWDFGVTWRQWWHADEYEYDDEYEDDEDELDAPEIVEKPIPVFEPPPKPPKPPEQP